LIAKASVVAPRPVDGELPSVTVVVPTIGRPKYVVDTVLSVLAQDYPRLKLFISDNAPKESTRSLLQAHGVWDERIVLIERAARMPFSLHMNACIAECDGDYLMILSDDDQIAPAYVSRLVGMFLEDAAISVGFGRQLVIGEDDTGLLPSPGETADGCVVDGTDFLHRMLEGRLDFDMATCFSMFARRKDILAAGGFRPYPDGSHADNFLCLQLALRGRVALSPQAMFYRVYRNSFGLSTPFPALLAATRAYVHDCASVLCPPAMRGKSGRALLSQIRASNVRMLWNRLRTVYARRLSTVEMIRGFASTALFSLIPVRRL
jgi:glycosyltransferase involved in cell wall biosynthesis